MPILRDMLTPEVAEGLDRYTAAQEVPDALPVAVNRILADWLTGKGYLPFVEDPEGEEAEREPRP